MFLHGDVIRPRPLLQLVVLKASAQTKDNLSTHLALVVGNGRRPTMHYVHSLQWANTFPSTVHVPVQGA